MTALAQSLLWLLSLVGADAQLGTCEGTVTRMGVAHFPSCPQSVLLSGQDLYVGMRSHRNEEAEEWTVAIRGEGDSWEVHFGAGAPIDAK